MKRISDKRLKKLGGKLPFSTITQKPTKVKKVNRKRRKSEFARTYHSAERVAFVKSLACVARTTMCNQPIDNAHIEGDGAGRKADYTKIIPLCRFHHEALHHEGWLWFEDMFMLDLRAEAAECESRWLAFSDLP